MNSVNILIQTGRFGVSSLRKQGPSNAVRGWITATCYQLSQAQVSPAQVAMELQNVICRWQISTYVNMLIENRSA